MNPQQQNLLLIFNVQRVVRDDDGHHDCADEENSDGN
jgi:hypothetical protein